MHQFCHLPNSSIKPDQNSPRNDTVTNVVLFDPAQRKDWPVAMHYLDQGGKGPLAIPNTAALVRGGPHEAEAR